MKSPLRFPVLLVLFLLPLLVTGVTFARGPGAETGNSGPALLLSKPTPTPDLARRTPTPYVEGHVSAVLAGEGLGGGGNYGDVTLYADTAFLQVRFNGCDEGYAIRQVNEDGSVVCQLTDNTIYSAGDGLLLDGAVFSADPAYLQRRVVDGCAEGYAIRQVDADGSVVCQLIDNTTYSAGDGLLLDGAVFSADPAYLQRRVVDVCAEGYAIRQVNANGSVVCWLIDNTMYSAGNQLQLDGTIFNVLDGSTSGLDADMLDGQEGSFYQSASNINTGTLGTDYYSAYSDLGAEGYLGNAAADLALNNGALQATLNADLLDSQHGSYYQSASNINTGTLGAGFYSAYSDLGVEGYLGNAAADLALNNGALQATLNADLLDGQHGSYYQSASNINAGTLGAGYYSAYSDLGTEGYLGNAAGDLALNNATLQATLNADLLDGISSASFWKLGGNVAGAAGVLGTSDNYTLEFWVNGIRALRLEPNATSPNIIGGYSGNWLTSGVYGAAIGGGGQSGYLNRVTDSYGTVAGGIQNQAGDNAGTMSDAMYATVGGGWGNTASGQAATVGGGRGNTVSSRYATVGGGYSNTAGYGEYATVPGGWQNTAQGSTSFAAGFRAKANNGGCFVWGDSYNADITCSTNDRWVARTSGGVYFYTNSALTSGVYVPAGGGAWSSVSDRNMKDNFAVVDTEELLRRLAAIPVSTWNYKSQDASIRHIGPMAQDFYAAFMVGEDDLHISTIDTDGVALAGVQGLYQRSEKQAEQITQLQRENTTLRERLDALEKGGGVQTAAASLPLGGLAPMAFGLLGVLAGVCISRRGRQR